MFYKIGPWMHQDQVCQGWTGDQCKDQPPPDVKVIKLFPTPIKKLECCSYQPSLTFEGEVRS